jgi:hypothetical protein
VSDTDGSKTGMTSSGQVAVARVGHTAPDQLDVVAVDGTAVVGEHGQSRLRHREHYLT